MAIHKLGPGRLTLDTTGVATEFSAMCSSVTLQPELETEDPVTLLSGDVYVDTAQNKSQGTLKGALYQEYVMTSLIAWSYQHAGETVTFEFVPATGQPLGFRGQCTIRPVAVGGDPGKANTSDFEFPLATMPAPFNVGG